MGTGGTGACDLTAANPAYEIKAYSKCTGWGSTLQFAFTVYGVSWLAVHAAVHGAVHGPGRGRVWWGEAAMPACRACLWFQPLACANGAFRVLAPLAQNPHPLPSWFVCSWLLQDCSVQISPISDPSCADPTDGNTTYPYGALQQRAYITVDNTAGGEFVIRSLFDTTRDVTKCALPGATGACAAACGACPAGANRCAVGTTLPGHAHA